MKDFNLYMSNLDYSSLIQFFQEKGEVRIYRKRDFFVVQNSPSRFLGWVETGIFHYSCLGKDGKEHIVGYSFPGEFVCDYSSFMSRSLSLVNIQAITECNVYQISQQDIVDFCDTNMETQRFGRRVADSLYEMVYRRLLEFYCNTPEERYQKLMERCPELKDTVPLKNIASFLGVTPETVSHIRKKILFKEKS